MTRNLTALLAAAVMGVAIAAPVWAQAATSSSPVRVARCEARSHPFDPPTGYTGGYFPPGGDNVWHDPYGHPFHQPNITRATPTIAIDYTNLSPKPIKQVDFGVVSDGKLVTEVRDVGTFSPGTEIKHEFGAEEAVLSATAPQCVPLRITFEDGTTWRNARVPSPR